MLFVASTDNLKKKKQKPIPLKKTLVISIFCSKCKMKMKSEDEKIPKIENPIELLKSFDLNQYI